jgi:hypothetical protein
LKPWRPSKLRFEVEAQRSCGFSLIVVHREAHRAARLAPFEAGALKMDVETLGLRLLLDEAGARHDHRVDAFAHALAADHAGGGAQILDAAIGAGADEHALDGDVDHRRARLQAHIVERAPLRGALVLVGDLVGIGTTPVMATTSSGEEPQVTIGGSGRRRGGFPCRNARPRPRRASSSSHSLVVGLARRRLRAALDIGEGLLVRRDQAGAGAALDRHVADGHAAFHGQRRGSPRRHIP